MKERHRKHVSYPAGRTSGRLYILCRVQCRMKMWGISAMRDTKLFASFCLASCLIIYIFFNFLKLFYLFLAALKSEKVKVVSDSL